MLIELAGNTFSHSTAYTLETLFFTWHAIYSGNTFLNDTEYAPEIHFHRTRNMLCPEICFHMAWHYFKTLFHMARHILWKHIFT